MPFWAPKQAGAYFQLHTVHQEHYDTEVQINGLLVLSTPHGTLGTYPPVARNSLMLSFQLHTVHQELKKCVIIYNCKNQTGFQLHTVHQERALHSAKFKGSFEGVFQLHTVHQEPQRKDGRCIHITNFQLHTVHQERWSHGPPCQNVGPFNSTRYIRNKAIFLLGRKILFGTFNSTRYIRNPIYLRITYKQKNFQLHTVHQEQAWKNAYRRVVKAFQLHTVHQERKCSLTKSVL